MPATCTCARVAFTVAQLKQKLCLVVGICISATIHEMIVTLQPTLRRPEWRRGSDCFLVGCRAVCVLCFSASTCNQRAHAHAPSQFYLQTVHLPGNTLRKVSSVDSLEGIIRTIRAHAWYKLPPPSLPALPSSSHNSDFCPFPGDDDVHPSRTVCPDEICLKIAGVL